MAEESSGLKKYRSEVVKRFRRIDKDFIERGFHSVREIISRTDDLCGPEDYGLYMAAQLDVGVLNQTREAADLVWNLIQAHSERSGEELPQELINQIWSDKRFTFFQKEAMLRRYAPDALACELQKYRANIHASALSERAKLCVCFGARPTVSLFGVDSDIISLRKQIANEVLSNALQAFGFEVTRMKRAHNRYRKPISSGVSMIFEMEKNTFDTQALPGDYDYGAPQYSPLVLKPLMYLESSRHDIHTNPFSPPGMSYSWITYLRYVDTHSLEVSLRAMVLWYELMIHPFLCDVVTDSRTRT